MSPIWSHLTYGNDSLSLILVMKLKILLNYEIIHL